MGEPGDESLIGHRLGAYEVLSALGAGGMGVVYRARDTTLGRDVAIKLLPELSGPVPDRDARFAREARVLASLNHPHIAAIYGFESWQGTRGLVLELVEGPTLADRLADGPLPIAEALELARQIADALEAAHGKGIVHRDLKPANIKLTAGGAAKVLDFGLAKAVESAELPSGAADPPTLTAAQTLGGAVLGTVAYMSPEQARGRPVDARTDVWAFGCVLYEMLSGRPAFRGDTISDIIAAVLEKEPDWRALPDRTPAAVTRALRRSLEKDARRRLRDIADARLDIDEALAAPEPLAAASSGAPPRRAQWTPWVIAAFGLVAAAGLLADRLARGPGVPAGVTALPGRFDLAAPPSTTANLFERPLAISPDGRRLAFSAGADGRSELWIRALDSLAAEPVPGTDRASYPFWSPDGRAVGFFAEGRLKVVDLASRAVTTLADASGNVGGAAWNAAGAIVFAGGFGAGLVQTSALGGDARPVTTLDPEHGETYHAWPQFLPDGRRFLYFAGSARAEDSGTYAGTLDSTERIRILSGATPVAYAEPGYLLFVRGGILFAQPFDAAGLRTLGEPSAIADHVWDSIGTTVLTSSNNGVLAYAHVQTPESRLTWFDRDGAEREPVTDPGGFSHVALSFDGTRALAERFETTEGNGWVWLVDLDRGVATPVSEPGGWGLTPVWSPDGSRFAFAASNDTGMGIYLRRADGTGADEPLLTTSNLKWPSAWSPDGRFVVYAEQSPSSGWDLWKVTVEGERTPAPLVAGRSDETYGRVSPDGRWLAYVSNESGKAEVYVRPLSDEGGRIQLSTGGGTEPVWGREGTEIFYVAPPAKLVAVAVSPGPSLKAGVPRPLFDVPIRATPWRTDYDVAKGGGRFLVNRLLPQPPAPPFTILVNWPRLVARQAP